MTIIEDKKLTKEGMLVVSAGTLAVLAMLVGIKLFARRKKK